VNGLGEKEARDVYENQGEESAIVNYEIAMNKIAVDESKVKCPLFFITTKDDRVCPPKMVEKIAGKYNADFKVYDGCHHIFANWQDIADGIQSFMTKLWLM
jgi:pimeloyl-ACP methyl ester carboxylesterase